MEAGAVEGPPTEVATEGQLLHTWMARGDWRTADDIADLATPDELTDEHVRQLVKCREFEAETATLDHFSECSTVHCEIPMELRDQDGTVLTAGTADRVVDGGSEISVIDWKMGRIPISPISGTLQIAAYAGMALQRYPDAQYAIGRIYQPRTGTIYKGAFTSISEIVRSIKAVIAAAEKPDAPLRPSLEACEFCTALTCPARQALVTLRAGDGAVSPLEPLLPEQRREIVLVAKLAEKWSGAVLDAAKEFIRAGGEIPGCTVETMRGNRKIEDVLAAFGAVQSVLDQDAYLQAMKVSVTKLEDAYAAVAVAKGLAKTKKAGKQMASNALAGVTTRDKDKHTLVITK